MVTPNSSNVGTCAGRRERRLPDARAPRKLSGEIGVRRAEGFVNVPTARFPDFPIRRRSNADAAAFPCPRVHWRGNPPEAAVPPPIGKPAAVPRPRCMSDPFCAVRFSRSVISSICYPYPFRLSQQRRPPGRRRIRQQINALPRLRPAPVFRNRAVSSRSPAASRRSAIISSRIARISVSRASRSALSKPAMKYPQRTPPNPNSPRRKPLSPAPKIAHILTSRNMPRYLPPRRQIQLPIQKPHNPLLPKSAIPNFPVSPAGCQSPFSFSSFFILS